MASRPSLEVSLTRAEPVWCARRESCRGAPQTKGLYPANTPLYSLTLKRDKSKISVCGDCFDHYKFKNSTIVTERVENQAPGGGRVGGHVVKGDVHIHKNVAAAQRHRVFLHFPKRSRFVPSGPHVVASNGNYNPEQYAAAQSRMRGRAMATSVHTGYTGAVTTCLVYQPPKGIRLQMLEKCSVTFRDIPVGIGYSQLLDTCFQNILPVYQTTIHVEMVDVNAVPLDVTAESNLIRPHFFKPAKDGIALVFNAKAKPCVVQLQVTSTWHSGYVRWTNEMEEEEIGHEEEAAGLKRKPTHSVRPQPRKRTKPAETKTLYADLTSIAGPFHAAPTSVSTSSPSPSLPSLSHAHAGVEVEPSTSPPNASAAAAAEVIAPHVLARALSRSTKATPEEARQLAQVRTFPVDLHMVKLLRLALLIELTNSGLPKLDTRFDPPSRCMLTIDNSVSEVGGFKTACFGTIATSPFASKLDKICAKQAYDKDHKVLTSLAQLEVLQDELMTHQWANALLILVYAHIATVREGIIGDGYTFWKPKLKVPKVRFAEAGLAIEQGVAGRAKVYMVEERITGPFKKFIHNGSARLSQSAQSDPVIAFLAFTQHAQYVLSNGMAFVSDYQGGAQSGSSDAVILSDPQLISDPKLGDIFAGGNVPSAFYNFCEEHVCNSFCTDFRLIPLDKFVPVDQ
ncbi:hypothetical protein GGX14DRAFT_396041 [Mycena pura]|uniref:Alpha-type protein kinase domain-containing protein n=1 Tax=Mycena pura TaxID=153505 RepID=A0AAD6VAU6_9AGAR|nr:hypothetical protein GGX14DRAFT_396041 [Mycena pura]